jgi:hypothetical protein
MATSPNKFSADIRSLQRLTDGSIANVIITALYSFLASAEFTEGKHISPSILMKPYHSTSIYVFLQIVYHDISEIL